MISPENASVRPETSLALPNREHLPAIVRARTREAAVVEVAESAGLPSKNFHLEVGALGDAIVPGEPPYGRASQKFAGKIRASSFPVRTPGQRTLRPMQARDFSDTDSRHADRSQKKRKLSGMRQVVIQ